MQRLEASSSKNIYKISENRDLAIFLKSSVSLHQFVDPNTTPKVYSPNWATNNLKIEPMLSVNNVSLALNSSGVTVTWKRKEGIAAETALTAGETVTNGILSVNDNKLADVASKQLTYICYVSYYDSKLKKTFNAQNQLEYFLVEQATNARTASVTGEQVFKYDSSGALISGDQIALNATVQGVNISKWQYKKADGSFVDYPSTSDNANITGSILYVKPTHAVFFSDVATIKLLTSDSDVFDVISIYKARDIKGNDGAGGVGYTTFLSNESQILSANSAGVCSAATIVTKVKALKNTTKVTPIVTAPMGLPSGMTFSQATADGEVTCTFTIAANATLGGADSGIINIAFTVDGQSFTKALSWSKSKAGIAGSNGADSVDVTITAPDGLVFLNEEGTLRLQATGYKGGTAITSGTTFQWAKLTAGNYVNISGATAALYTVQPSNVDGIATFRCTMTYASKTYTDYATIQDKKDILQCESIVLNPEFKNDIGETLAYARLFLNGKEVDELKGTTMSETAPSSPKNGDFYYALNKSTKTVTLMKYNGSAWVAATGNDLHKGTYNWYRIKTNNVSLDSAAYRTGKVIYLNDADVPEDILINCEASIEV